MVSSLFAGIPFSPVDLDKTECQSCRSAAADEKTTKGLSGGRLQFGMVAGINSERWPE
jgi:hypothetical protein